MDSTSLAMKTQSKSLAMRMQSKNLAMGLLSLWISIENGSEDAEHELEEDAKQELHVWQSAQPPISMELERPYRLNKSAQNKSVSNG